MTLRLHRLYAIHPQRLIDLPAPPAWTVDALCAQVDGDLFFPSKGGPTAEAKKICQQCPVRLDCLEHALRNDERFGVWGGVSERERRQIRAERRSA